MAVSTGIFMLAAALLIAGALCVISSWDPVRGVLALIGCFFAASVMWLLLESEFLALILILVYVGAVMVLFLFVVMMLHVRVGDWRTHWVRYWPVSVGLGLVLVAELAWILGIGPVPSWFSGAAPPRPADYNHLVELGRVLFTDYVYPFEVAGVILSVAIVAAIALTVRGPRKRQVQQASAQLMASPETHVRLEKGIGPS